MLMQASVLAAARGAGLDLDTASVAFAIALVAGKAAEPAVIVYLVRHGETGVRRPPASHRPFSLQRTSWVPATHPAFPTPDWNREGRMQGQLDIPLNALGEDQAARLGQSLLVRVPQIDHVASSDLQRAAATARAIVAARGPAERTRLGQEGQEGQPIHMDPRLREAERLEFLLNKVDFA